MKKQLYGIMLGVSLFTLPTYAAEKSGSEEETSLFCELLGIGCPKPQGGGGGGLIIPQAPGAGGGSSNDENG